MTTKPQSESEGLRALATPRPWVTVDEERFGVTIHENDDISTTYSVHEIVRAVNAHDALVAALKNIRANAKALPEIISRGACLRGDMEGVDYILTEAEAALKLAGEV